MAINLQYIDLVVLAIDFGINDFGFNCGHCFSRHFLLGLWVTSSSKRATTSSKWTSSSDPVSISTTARASELWSTTHITSSWSLEVASVARAKWSLSVFCFVAPAKWTSTEGTFTEWPATERHVLVGSVVRSATIAVMRMGTETMVTVRPVSAFKPFLVTDVAPAEGESSRNTPSLMSRRSSFSSPEGSRPEPATVSITVSEVRSIKLLAVGARSVKPLTISARSV